MRVVAPDVPVITTLRADIVPLRELALRRWYCASPVWYYHRRAFPAEITTHRKFYQMIDPHLRDLCRLMHRAGVHTTPSCQGHFYDRAHYQHVWTELERQERLIQTDGLPVVDSSTGNAFVFRASTFELPWLSFDEFHAQAAAHQTVGYLGLLLPRHHHALICQLHNTPFQHDRARIEFDGELSCVLGGSLFAVTIHARNEQENASLWRQATDHLRSLLLTRTSRPGERPFTQIRGQNIRSRLPL